VQVGLRAHGIWTSLGLLGANGRRAQLLCVSISVCINTRTSHKMMLANKLSVVRRITPLALHAPFRTNGS
jgi:hypothetical protein